MSIASMTGFARSDGAHEIYSWNWEVKSVNGKGLDIRCRLPNGLESLEPDVRAHVRNRFARGNFQIGLHIMRQSGQTDIEVNEQALKKVLEVIDALPPQANVAPANLDGILSLRGVLEFSEPEETEEQKANRDKALLESLDEALAALRKARLSEGEKLQLILRQSVEKIQVLAQAARETAALQPDALRARLKSQVEELLQASPTLPEDRLIQEAAILITKADIREEIDRLGAHATAAYELLEKDEPVGRRLDFLMQEFNREANTLCSKSSDVELTRIGLDLKAVIDQVREQVQNIE